MLQYVGTIANDTLFGRTAADTLIGGLGDDRLSGGSGNDTYFWARGDGSDTIIESTAGGFDRLVLGAGVFRSQVSVKVSGNGMRLVIAPSTPGGSDGGVIYLPLELITNAGIEEIAFDDGNVLDRSALITQMLTVQGTSADDVLTGSSYIGANRDTIMGGRGDDKLYGRDGDDEYLWTRGDGNDTIYEALNQGFDRISLGVGVSQDDVTVERSGATGYTIRIRATDPARADGGAINIQNGLLAETGIEAIVFADGSVWEKNRIRLMTLIVNGTSGNDRLTGSVLDDNADNTLVGNAGDDRLSGSIGDDVYIWKRGDGNDAIVEKQAEGSDDRLLLGAGITTKDVRLIRSGNNLRVIIEPSEPASGDGGSITALNQWAGINAGIEVIVFDDGTTWDAAFINAAGSSLTGDNANNLIVGTGGADTLHGMRGKDTLRGGTGDDEYRWSRGDGNDEIYEATGEGSDSLILADVITDDAFLARMGDDLVVNIAGSAARAGGRIVVRDQFLMDDGLDQIVFADGVTWNALDDFWDAGWSLFGDASGNRLEGGDELSDTDDTLQGMGGSDTLSGGYGDDKYCWSRHDGNDLIDEWAYGGADRLVLGAGISQAQVSLAQDGHDLMIRIAGAGGGVIRVSDQYAWDGSRVEEIVFADRAVWTLPSHPANVLRGDVEDAFIVGTPGSDTLDGLDWFDTLCGGSGDDTYVLRRRPNACDALIQEESGGGFDRILFGHGILPSQVSVWRDRDNLIINANRVYATIVGQFGAGGPVIEQMVFENGTIWDAAMFMDTHPVPGGIWSLIDVTDQRGFLTALPSVNGKSWRIDAAPLDDPNVKLLTDADAVSALVQTVRLPLQGDIIYSFKNASANDPWYANTSAPDGGWEKPWRIAIEAAMNRAASVIGLTVRQRTNAEAAAGTGHISFGWWADENGNAASGLPSTSGGMDQNGNGSFDVLCLPSYGLQHNDLQSAPTIEYWDAPAPEYQQTFLTMLHEIGHALGLLHPFELENRFPSFAWPTLESWQPGAFGLNSTFYTVMSYRDGFEALDPDGEMVNVGPFAPITFMALDVAALQLLYGVNASTHTGNDVYRLTNGAIYCIWDAGGVDTLDFSAEGSAAVMDLRAATLKGEHAGGFVSWSGTGALSIAYGAVIENAIGGQADDRIVGNAAGNNLVGGAGSDTLDGGAGDDILSGGAGADRFVFGAGFGSDRITDFAVQGPEHDLIQFDAAIFSSWTDILAHARQSGSDVVIAAPQGDTLTLADVSLSALSRFSFVIKQAEK